MINVFEIKNAVKKRDSLEGRWLGTVKDNADPAALNRIKVELDDLSKGISTEDLPWYIVLTPADSKSNSGVSLPRVNSRVLVEFPTNDFYNGIVTNSINITPPTEDN